MNILEQLAEYSRVRVEADKKKINLDQIKKMAFLVKEEALEDFAFEKALKKQELAFICECKKASPSKGVIDHKFQYLDIAKEYEMAGVDCISVLTEPKWFLGSDEYLREIAHTVKIPCLRKDFTVDTENSRKLRDLIPYDILFVSESGVKDVADIRKIREMGADAVLIGETMMRAHDKSAKLKELRGVL